MKKYQELANTIGALVDQKNEAYGNSFDQAGEFLKMLYPQGVSPENYNDMLCIVRMFDKLKRIATKKDAFGEDPFADIVGYALLAVHRNKQPKCGEEVGEKQLLMEKTVLKEVSESVVAPEATEYFKKFDLTSPVYSIKKFDPNHQETHTTVEREMLRKVIDQVQPQATPEHVTGQEPLTLIVNQTQATPTSTPRIVECGQYIPGHHAGNCTLAAGHEGYCRE